MGSDPLLNEGQHIEVECAESHEPESWIGMVGIVNDAVASASNAGDAKR